jgi:hypothetical protein
MMQDVQVIISPPNEQETEQNEDQLEEESKNSESNPFDLSGSNAIRIELIGDNSGTHHGAHGGKKITPKSCKDLTAITAANTAIIQAADISKKLSAAAAGAGVGAGVSSTADVGGGAMLVVPPEHEYYYNNGITEQQNTSKLEFESIITKKSNIVYKTHKLNLKKKSE